MLRSHVAPAALAVSLLIACGGAGEEGDLQETIEGFYRALNDNPPKAYTYLAETCRDQLPYGEFFGYLSFTLGKGYLGEGDLEVKSVEVVEERDDELEVDYEAVLVVDGDEIPLEVGEEAQASTPFVKEDGRWRFADCAGFGGGQGGSGETTPAVTPESDGRLAEARAAEADDDPSLPGEYVDLPAIYAGAYSDTADHVSRQLDYAEQGLPPAGGPHWGSGACPNDPSEAPDFCGPVPWGIYRDPWEAESLVHNMEHGGVVIWYNSSDQALVQELEALVEERLTDGQMLVLTPFPDMAAETIALTSWSRRDTFPAGDYTRQRAEAFIDAHERRFNPEGL